ncbi:hypothetical protein KKB40_05325, partial [Patescibacteria group bacterium]|nr:hypothetical protein [Patescibacteria group bacterium]
MSKETRKSHEFQGVALQETVKRQLGCGLRQAVEMELPEMVAYIGALQNHFDEFSEMIDWDDPKTESESITIVGSTIASICLAYTRTQRDCEQLYGLSDENTWWKVIKDVLEEENTKDVFLKNMWRSPILVSPLRGIPLQYLLGYHFGDKQIRGVDLGAGLHVALPLLNSSKYLDAGFPEKSKIKQYANRVNVSVGLGIDKQDRPDSLDWAKACYWPLKKNLQAGARLERLYYEALSKNDQYPFLVSDISNRNGILQSIRQKVGDDDRFDFVFSSFVRHQLGGELTQLNFQKLVFEL